MAKQAPADKAKPGPVARMRAFVQEVKVELSKVTWPSKEDLKASTQVVMILLVIMAALVWAYDVTFQGVMVWLLQFG